MQHKQSTRVLDAKSLFTCMYEHTKYGRVRESRWTGKEAVALPVAALLKYTRSSLRRFTRHVKGWTLYVCTLYSVHYGHSVPAQRRGALKDIAHTEMQTAANLNAQYIQILSSEKRLRKARARRNCLFSIVKFTLAAASGSGSVKR